MRIFDLRAAVESCRGWRVRKRESRGLWSLVACVCITVVCVCVHMCVVGMATALSFSHKPDLRLDLCRWTLPSTCSTRTLALCLSRRVYHHNPAWTCHTMHCAPEQLLERFFCCCCCHSATYFRMYSRVTSLLLRSYDTCTELQRHRCKKIQFVALLLPIICVCKKKPSVTPCLSGNNSGCYVAVMLRFTL